MRKAVREQIAAGADWIKVYADYRRAPGAPSTPTFSEEELRSAVEEAHSAGKPVAAHATTDEGIRRAVAAGVTTIEHGYGASRQTLQMMKERGITLCPTMAAAEAIALYAGWRPQAGGSDPRAQTPASVTQSRVSFALAREVGVNIASGSDVGVFPHGENARELELMVAGGMNPREAIAAATSVAAKVIDHEKDLGRIDAGFIADLVLLRGDALADISALRGVAMVIKGGDIVLDRRDAAKK
jgi:imidazolonepropionase-like amidohydrolase